MAATQMKHVASIVTTETAEGFLKAAPKGFDELHQRSFNTRHYTPQIRG
jgi:hypothetical protein